MDEEEDDQLRTGLFDGAVFGSPPELFEADARLNRREKAFDGAVASRELPALLQGVEQSSDGAEGTKRLLFVLARACGLSEGVECVRKTIEGDADELQAEQDISARSQPEAPTPTHLFGSCPAIVAANNLLAEERLARPAADPVEEVL